MEAVWTGWKLKGRLDVCREMRTARDAPVDLFGTRQVNRRLHLQVMAQMCPQPATVPILWTMLRSWMFRTFSICVCSSVHLTCPHLERFTFGRGWRFRTTPPVHTLQPFLSLVPNRPPLALQCVDPGADSETQRFQALVAAMISSQTKDPVTAAAMLRLRALPGGLTIANVAAPETTLETLQSTLHPVGFFRCAWI